MIRLPLSVCRFPSRGRVLPELDREDVRELIKENYRIVYRMLKEAVDTLTLFEAHKQFDSLEQ